MSHSKIVTRNVFSSPTRNKKNFYLKPPVSNCNNRVWVGSKKADVKPACLLGERKKFAQHEMVSAGMCFGCKGRLHFVDENAKVDSVYLAETFLVLGLLTTPIDCCPVDTSSSKMVRQHTQLVSCRTGSKPTAQISLPKTSGLQIYPT